MNSTKRIEKNSRKLASVVGNASIESLGLASRLQPKLLLDLTLRERDLPFNDPRCVWIISFTLRHGVLFLLCYIQCKLYRPTDLAFFSFAHCHYLVQVPCNWWTQCSFAVQRSASTSIFIMCSSRFGSWFTLRRVAIDSFIGKKNVWVRFRLKWNRGIRTEICI